LNSPDEILENTELRYAFNMQKCLKAFWILLVIILIPVKDGIKNNTKNEIRIFRCILSLSPDIKVKV